MHVAPVLSGLTRHQIIVEDEDGEVLKTYELPSQKAEGQESSDPIGASLKYLGLGAKARNAGKSPESAAEEGQAGGASASPARPPLKASACLG